MVDEFGMEKKEENISESQPDTDLLLIVDLERYYHQVGYLPCRRIQQLPPLSRN